MIATPDILQKVEDDAKQRISSQEPVASNLYIETKILPAGYTIIAGTQKIITVTDSIMVFADDMPLANWSHPCRYFLYEADTAGFLNEQIGRFPPYMFDLPKTYFCFYSPVKRQLYAGKPQIHIPSAPVSPTVARNKFALLFSGASEYRHVNDLQYLYTQLTKEFNYPIENIYVLNYDGTWRYSSFEPPVDNFPILNVPYDMKINGSGNRTELLNVLEELRKRIKPDDHLFIHTNNHGDGPSEDDDPNTQSPVESSLCMYSPDGLLDVMSASEFGEQLALFPKFSQLMVLMEQCHSGGFQDSVIKNSKAYKTCFMAACEADQNSIGWDYFDPFTHQWTNIIAGEKLEDIHETLVVSEAVPNSASGAFHWATLAVHEVNNPVMGDSPVGCGMNMYLNPKMAVQ